MKNLMILAFTALALTGHAQDKGVVLQWKDTTAVVFKNQPPVKELDFGGMLLFRVYTFENKQNRTYSVLFKCTGKTETWPYRMIYSEIKMTVGGVDPYNIWLEEKYIRQKGHTIDLIYHMIGTERMAILYDVNTGEWRL